MKLTQEQKDSIKSELFTKIKNAEVRSKILTTAYGYAEENGKDGDIESMVLYLMDNQDKVNELFNEYGMSMPYASEVEQSSKKDKK
jgi:hypothetical protein